jgi:hypothetical protein
VRGRSLRPPAEQRASWLPWPARMRQFVHRRRGGELVRQSKEVA